MNWKSATQKVVSAVKGSSTYEPRGCERQLSCDHPSVTAHAVEDGPGEACNVCDECGALIEWIDDPREGYSACPHQEYGVDEIRQSRNWFPEDDAEEVQLLCDGCGKLLDSYTVE